MLLNGIFYSIQGEGVHAGAPAVFVRFGNCNLRCVWCDTKYAWKDNKEISIPVLCREIRKFKNCRHLVITGGEPMLQQDAIRAIRKAFPDYYIEVETNGSQRVECFKDVDLFTVSYKTSASGNMPYMLKTKNKKCIYKFVIKDKKDFAEIGKIIKKYALPKSKIWLMPEGVNVKQILKKHRFIIECCKRKGYNFTTRLHILSNIK